MTQVMGVSHTRDGIEVQSVVGADMSVIGIVGTAPGANPSLIPLNTPIQINTNDTVMRAALGTLGTVPQAIEAISLNLETAAAKVVVVIVEEGANAAATITNIVGSEVNRTGMWALLDAPGELTVTPRLIIVPGYTSQTVTGLTSITITDGGDGYFDEFNVTATGGTGSGFLGRARVLNGAVIGVDIVNPGNYTAAPTGLSFAAGAGSGATATLTTGNSANQIVVNMPTILSRLKAKFLPEGPTASYTAWANWVETIPQDYNILHPLSQDAKVEVNGSIVTRPLSPYIIGLYVRRDQEYNGIPSHSAANQSVNGIVGISPAIPLDITADGSLGMQFIEAHGGIVVKGDIGVDTSLSDGGFVFWGTDTLAAETEWLFANVVRMRDYVEINNTRALRIYIGAQNITTQTVQAIFNTMDEQLSRLKADSHILDFRLGFDPGLNSTGDLRLGKVTITMRMEEPPVLRLINIRSRKYAQALEELVTNIAIQLGVQQAA